MNDKSLNEIFRRNLYLRKKIIKGILFATFFTPFAILFAISYKEMWTADIQHEICKTEAFDLDGFTELLIEVNACSNSSSIERHRGYRGKAILKNFHERLHPYHVTRPDDLRREWSTSASRTTPKITGTKAVPYVTPSAETMFQTSCHKARL